MCYGSDSGRGRLSVAVKQVRHPEGFVYQFDQHFGVEGLSQIVGAADGMAAADDVGICAPERNMTGTSLRASFSLIRSHISRPLCPSRLISEMIRSGCSEATNSMAASGLPQQ